MDPINEWRTISDVAVEYAIARERIMKAIAYFKVKIVNGRIHQSDASTIGLTLAVSEPESIGKLGSWSNLA